MGDVLAIISKAQFEAEHPTAQVGDLLGYTKYVSTQPALQTLGEGGRLFLVTVRPPDERLWLLAELINPRHDGKAWAGRRSKTRVRDVTELLRTLKFVSGKGISAKKRALGMSLQTPRQLTSEDVTALRKAPTQRNDSALPEAAFDGNQRKVEALLKSGAQLEALDESGQTALNNAALSGNVALVRLLLKKGANPKHASQQWKSTGLHLAVEANAPDIVSLLLSAGTDPKVKDRFGQTALDVAVERKHSRLIALLGGKAPAAKTVVVKAAKTLRLPKPPFTRWSLLSSLQTWRASTRDQRLGLAERIADVLGDDWKPTGALQGREALAEVLHGPSATRFVAIPAGAFISGVREEEVALAHTLDWQEDFTLESLTANPKAATIAPFLCARAPSSETGLARKRAQATLTKTPFRVMTPLEWEFVARDGGDSPFINARTPKEAEAACRELYGQQFNAKKKSHEAFGVWGLALGEWVSRTGTRVLTGACGGPAQLCPWQGDELIDCLAGQRESVNSFPENTLRFALTLPK